MKTIKARVRAVTDQEFGVRALLDDLSAIKHKDAVREANGVSGMEKGPSVGLRIQARSRLVEDHDGGIAQHCLIQELHSYF